jgi:hypothetical protein
VDLRDRNGGCILMKASICMQGWVEYGIRRAEEASSQMLMSNWRVKSGRETRGRDKKSRGSILTNVSIRREGRRSGKQDGGKQSPECFCWDEGMGWERGKDFEYLGKVGKALE